MLQQEQSVRLTGTGRGGEGLQGKQLQHAGLPGQAPGGVALAQPLLHLPLPCLLLALLLFFSSCCSIA